MDRLRWGVLAHDVSVAPAEGVGRGSGAAFDLGNGNHPISNGSGVSGWSARPAWALKAPSPQPPIRSIAAPWLAITPDSPSGGPRRRRGSRPGTAPCDEFGDVLTCPDDGGDVEVVVGGDLVHPVSSTEADHQVRVPEVRRPLVAGADGDRRDACVLEGLDGLEQLGPRRRRGLGSSPACSNRSLLYHMPTMLWLYGSPYWTPSMLNIRSRPG